MTTTLKITAKAFEESLLVRGDLSQASSQIEVNYLVDNGWDGTPMQCANVRHRDSELAAYGAQLLAEACECDEIELGGYEYEEVGLFNRDADTEHEDAREWYESYGWHLSPESGNVGDVTLQSVEYDWLDDESGDEAREKLAESHSYLTEDEVNSIVEMALSVRSSGESICSLLDEAVTAYESEDYEACVKALDAAYSAESDHGDSPASKSLRSALLADLPSDVESALK